MSYKKILITGSEGLIGKKLKEVLGHKYDIVGLDLKNDHDLTNEAFVEDWFKNNKLDGKWIHFHENRKKSLEFEYKNGKRNGEYKTWFHTGQLKEDGFYITSGSEIWPGETTLTKDDSIYVLNFKRDRFKDQIEEGTWTLTLSGSHDGTAKTINLTDDRCSSNEC